MDFSLIFDWLGREGGDILAWWLLVTLAGAAAWPLLMRVASGLPDRGYTLARAAGVMLTGFLFWFLGSVGFLHNTPGAMVFAWMVVIAASVAAYGSWDARPNWREWWREHRALVIVTEIVFAGLFIGWAAVRAHQPEIASTEKPMEIMFINAIRGSETFPPRDAWLSGYAISYYYFGYVIIAMLADLSAVNTGTAFNLAIALITSLTAIGALGVVYNLVRAPLRRRSVNRDASVPAGAPQGIAAGVLAIVLLLFMGNLGTAFVELPYRGYAPDLVNAEYFDFWNVREREGTTEITLESGETVTRPVDADGDGIANWEDEALPFDQWSFTWGLGWRYSRIVNDRDLNGTPVPVQPITEFPNFSLLLADIHPHVLSLPFTMLAIGLALSLVLRGGDELRAWEFFPYAIWVGGMVFVNSWDASYIVLLIGAEVLRRVLRNDGVLHDSDYLPILRFAAIIGALTVVLYLPWLVSFTSQAGGILPNLIYPTAWQQYFLQFGVFVVILAVFLAAEFLRAGERFNALLGLLAVKLSAFLAVVLMLLLGFQAWDRADVFGSVFAGVDRATESFGGVLPDVLQRRLSGLPSELLMLVFVFLVVGRLFARRPRDLAESSLDDRELGDDQVVRVRAINFSPATGFALLLIGAGVVLTMVPDVLYLRDNFSVRINTVFKLYYQGWIMFSVASAYAVWSLLASVPAAETAPSALRTIGRPVFAIVVVALVTAGLLYPVFALRGRILIDTGRLSTQERAEACEDGEEWARNADGSCPEQSPLTLNGDPTMVSSGEYSAIQCLADLETSGDAILVEAPGGAYEPQKSRFSALTGIPTLIGWQNHERQWRGPTYPDVTDYRIENGARRDRVSDVQDLYTTQDWDRAWAIIDRYGIDYIVVGSAERLLPAQLASDDATRLADYQRGLEKFAQVLTPVCDSGSAVVYRVAPQ